MKKLQHRHFGRTMPVVLSSRSPARWKHETVPISLTAVFKNSRAPPEKSPGADSIKTFALRQRLGLLAVTPVYNLRGLLIFLASQFHRLRTFQERPNDAQG